MPAVTLEQATFERLQRHAEPLVDTLDTVIMRALEALERLAPEEEAEHRAAPERPVDPRNLPSLTHTKVLEAAIGGRAVTKPNWSQLLDEMVRAAKAAMGSYEKARHICPVNMVKGRKEDEGYHYLSDVDISVQGQDANDACRAIIMAARALDLDLEIGFVWRDKQAAAFPGERGRIRVGKAR